VSKNGLALLLIRIDMLVIRIEWLPWILTILQRRFLNLVEKWLCLMAMSFWNLMANWWLSV